MGKLGKSLKRFNTRTANYLSGVMSSMWLFWFLTISILVAGIIHPPEDPYMFVMFVIGAGFQAIALPVLAFVSNNQGDRAEKTSQQTLAIVKEDLELLKKQNTELKQLISEIKADAKREEQVAESLDKIENKLDELPSSTSNK